MTTTTAAGLPKRGLPVLTACCVLACLGCVEDTPPPPEPAIRAVKLLEIGSKDQLALREYPGKIAAATSADVSFEVDGLILEYPVSQGQWVTRGELLARLDPSDHQARLDASIAQRDAALADFERYQELLAKDAVSRRDFETRKRNWEVAEANLRIEQKNLDDTRLLAPFAGQVAIKYVERYQNVRAKEPILLLQDSSRLEIDVSLPEADVLRIDRSLDLRALSSRLKPVVVISSLSGTVFPAHLTELATTADPATRTFEATFAFDTPPDLTILPGMTAAVRVSAGLAVLDRGFAIPVNATVIDASGAASVWMVDPVDMEVHRADVVLGELLGDSIVVDQGLERGDLIVVSGANQLRDGMRVRSLETP